ncbi:MAG: SgcJ/EcaC family oxidoreductase [Eudoraea sp.]|nr:SgcJ/EcaC family oxidoreductase [Eudoraea sp.]
MKYLIGIAVLVLIFIIGFWVGSKYAETDFPNQGVLISSGPELEEVQQITGEYVRTHLAADYEECSSLFAEHGVYMVPGRPSLKGRSEIKAYLKESFTGRGDNKILDMKEPAEEVVFFGDYAAVRGTGYDNSISADSTITKSTYKWMVLAHRNSKGTWETVWDIYNED